MLTSRFLISPCVPINPIWKVFLQVSTKWEFKSTCFASRYPVPCHPLLDAPHFLTDVRIIKAKTRADFRVATRPAELHQQPSAGHRRRQGAWACRSGLRFLRITDHLVLGPENSLEGRGALWTCGTKQQSLSRAGVDGQTGWGVDSASVALATAQRPPAQACGACARWLQCLRAGSQRCACSRLGKLVWELPVQAASPGQAQPGGCVCRAGRCAGAERGRRGRRE